jgi:tetratricopeptide (TPR) repeat protein
VKQGLLILLTLLLLVSDAWAQTSPADKYFHIALPTHKGQLHWQAEGFKIVQSSAKPNGNEIGLRGKDSQGRLEFLGFLFMESGPGTPNGARCRDGVLGLEQKENKTIKILKTWQLRGQNGGEVEMVTYTSQNARHGTTYVVRGFSVTSDLCGDLELYGDIPISFDDPGIKNIFESYTLEANYDPQFRDVFLYAQILYRDHRYREAAPLFEASIEKLGDGKDQTTMRRVATDQAGMAYGISGNIQKARTLFNEAITTDPEYPMYYYNLACADAEEKKLSDARLHLQQAFERKGNMLPGEKLPDPSKDDSFLPYRNNKEFWTFIEALH